MSGLNKTLVQTATAMSFILVMMFNQLKEMWINKTTKKNTFECGLEPIFSKKTSFSTAFMMISMVFLVFDAEISFLVPPIMMNKSLNKNTQSLSMVFLILLTLIMMKEWNLGSIEWSK